MFQLLLELALVSDPAEHSDVSLQGLKLVVHVLLGVVHNSDSVLKALGL